jgi:hypothetical protein
MTEGKMKQAKETSDSRLGKSHASIVNKSYSTMV